MYRPKKNFNRYVKREHFQLPTRGEIFGDLADAKYFSKLDASSALALGFALSTLLLGDTLLRDFLLA